MKASNYYLLIVLGLATACQIKLDPTAYKDWVRTNLTKQRIIAPYVFDVMQRTNDFETLVRNNKKDWTLEAFTAEKEKVEGLEYYEVRIGINDQAVDIISYNTSTLQEKQANIYYFSYDFQKDIYLMKGDQKIPCTLFHFERSYNLNNTRSFMLGFKVPEHLKSATSTLVIHGQQLNTGPVKFKFPTINQPELAFK